MSLLLARVRTPPLVVAPERNDRRQYHASLQQAVAFVAVVVPVVVPTFFQSVTPDWLPPKRVQQPDSETLTPRDRTAPAAAVFAPERLDPARRAQQPDSLTWTPQTIAAVVTYAAAIAPEALPPRRVQQPDAEVLTPRDRAAPAAAAFAPEWIDRRRPPQQPDSFVFTPRDRSSPAAAAFAPEWIDRRRPQQPDALVRTSTDRTAPLAVVVAPEWIDRRRPQQPDSETLTSRDRTAPIAVVVAPEWIDRKVFPVFEQLSFVFTPRDETIEEPTEAVYPAWLPPRRVQQPDSETLTPRDQSSPAAAAFAPEWIDRRVYPTHAQLAFVFTPRDRTAPLATVTAPEWIDRRRPQQPDSFVFTSQDRTAPIAVVVAPEWIDRRRPQQPDSETLTPRDRAAPAAAAFAPEWIDRRRPQQPDALVVTLQPPPIIFPQSAYFPDAIDRRTYHASQQLAFIFPHGRHLAGVTRDAACTPLPFCTVHLFRTSDDVEVAQQVSDAAGNFDFTLFDDGTVQYYIVAYLAGAPDVAGTTLNTLVST